MQSSNKFCRTCLQANSPTISVFEPHFEHLSVQEFLKECTSVHITNHDKLPKFICCDCLKQLKYFYNFKKQCLASEKTLLALYDGERNIPNNKTESLVAKNKQTSETDVLELDTSRDSTKSFLNEKKAEEKANVRCKSPQQVSQGNVQLVNGKNKYVCVQCEVFYTSKDSLNRHIRNKHALKKYKCETCNEEFIHYRKWLNHSFKHGHHCPTCLKPFSTVDQLQEHVLEHKNHTDFVCKDCGKEFRKKELLITHYTVHKKERLHLCTICGKTFPRSSSLSTHMTVHNAQKRYSCNTCSKKFSQRSSWIYHIKTHISEKSFVCANCGKAFTTWDKLRRHSLIHTQQRIRKHKCSFCTKQFHRASDLNVHLRVHTGERPFVCTICERGFTQPHVLKNHLKIHQKT